MNRQAERRRVKISKELSQCTCKCPYGRNIKNILSLQYLVEKKFTENSCLCTNTVKNIFESQIFCYMTVTVTLK